MLTQKYRPLKLNQVYGHDTVIDSLTNLLKQDRKQIPHTFLFVGSYGLGKTTLGRILGQELNCEILEINAAVNTGVDHARETIAGLQYPSLSGKSGKLVLIDECHKLSSEAWQAYLKPLEEPYQHVYFVLCTTELNKVPKTAKSRATTYELKPLSFDILSKLIQDILTEEKMDVMVSDKVFEKLIEKSEGSARQAVTFLEQVLTLEDEKAMLDVLDVSEEQKAEVIDLCRAIMGKHPWTQVSGIVQKLKGGNYEGYRIQMLGYFTACLLKGNSVECISILHLLAEKPFYTTSTAYYDFVLCIGKIQGG